MHLRIGGPHSTTPYLSLFVRLILPFFSPEDTKKTFAGICSSHVTFAMFWIKNGIQTNEW